MHWWFTSACICIRGRVVWILKNAQFFSNNFQMPSVLYQHEAFNHASANTKTSYTYRCTTYDDKMSLRMAMKKKALQRISASNSAHLAVNYRWLCWRTERIFIRNRRRIFTRHGGRRRKFPQSRFYVHYGQQLARIASGWERSVQRH